jgi:regulator of RNase E activity RraA
MGRISASIGRRQGELGAIVDGAVRDIDHSREIGYPIWSRSVSPITGKWRIKTVAVNRPVSICSVTVSPGDLVLADEVGVCFVPHKHADEVLEHAQRIAANEKIRQARISSGAPISELLPKAR